jgi:peptidoglycan/xylan/chitin deacetylase (PgdA/CDA1 family)
MKPLKVRTRQAVGSLLWRAGRARAQQGTLTVLMYHAVTQGALDEPGQMSVSAERFARQMGELHDSGARVVDLAAGAEALRRGAHESPAVAIVFDDGFVGVHDYAADVLSGHRFSATVFVSTSWIGRVSMPLADARLGRPMTWGEVQQLHGAGFAVGSHTHTHATLAALSEAQMQDEVRRSSAAIADHVGRLPDTFAYPFGSFGTFDARTRAVLRAHGFRAACTTVAGRNDASTELLELKRIRVSRCDGDGEIRKAIAGCYDWYRWVQRLQRARGPMPADAEIARC